jgi:hypothetical protein
MLLVLLTLAALAPGIATSWLLRRHGPLIAVLAGAGVAFALPFLLVVSLVLFPPLGIVLAAGAGIAALEAYDRGKVWMATAWAGVMALASACAGWPR